MSWATFAQFVPSAPRAAKDKAKEREKSKSQNIHSHTPYQPTGYWPAPRDPPYTSSSPSILQMPAYGDQQKQGYMEQSQDTGPDLGTITVSHGALLRIVQPSPVRGIQANALNSVSNQFIGHSSDLLGSQNQFLNMHNPSYMFNAPDVNNEYNLLNDFLNNSLLDDGAFLRKENTNSHAAVTSGGLPPSPYDISLRTSIRAGRRRGLMLKERTNKICVSYTISEDMSGDRRKRILSRIGEKKRDSGEVSLRIRSSYADRRSLRDRRSVSRRDFEEHAEKSESGHSPSKVRKSIIYEDMSEDESNLPVGPRNIKDLALLKTPSWPSSKRSTTMDDPAHLGNSSGLSLVPPSPVATTRSSMSKPAAADSDPDAPNSTTSTRLGSPLTYSLSLDFGVEPEREARNRERLPEETRRIAGLGGKGASRKRQREEDEEFLFGRKTQRSRAPDLSRSKDLPSAASGIHPDRLKAALYLPAGLGHDQRPSEPIISAFTRPPRKSAAIVIKRPDGETIDASKGFKESPALSGRAPSGGSDNGGYFAYRGEHRGDRSRGRGRGWRDDSRDTGSESPRDFPPREPPRGPRGLIDAPTGRRTSSYGSDYRGDFGYRGEYRGDWSRGRGRGWRTISTATKTNETKPRIGKDEVDILEWEFKKNPKPTTQTKRQFAEEMGVELARINNWFQNRRAKRKQEKKEEAWGNIQNNRLSGRKLDREFVGI